jgi:ketosteroid isomerase-like protein
MGRARELWEALGAALEKADVDAIFELYAVDAVFLEPQNPPHETDRLIQAYLSSWLNARADIDITTKRLVESTDGLTCAVEWSLSYTAGTRRWKDLPRTTWIDAEDDLIRYQRDYF